MAAAGNEIGGGHRKETAVKAQTCFVAFATAFAIAAVLPGAAMAGPSFQGLGDLPGGIFASQAEGVAGQQQPVVRRQCYVGRK